MKNTEEQLAWINTKDAELTKAQKKEIIEKYMRKKNAEIKALKGNKKRAELVKEISLSEDVSVTSAVRVIGRNLFGNGNRCQ